MRHVNAPDMASKHFSVHVYITSVPAHAPEYHTPVFNDAHDEVGFWGQSHASAQVMLNT